MSNREAVLDDCLAAAVECITEGWWEAANVWLNAMFMEWVYLYGGVED